MLVKVKFKNSKLVLARTAQMENEERNTPGVKFEAPIIGRIVR